MDTLKELSFSQQLVLNIIFLNGTLEASGIAILLDWDEEKAQEIVDSLVKIDFLEAKKQTKHYVDVIEDHTGLKHRISDTRDITTYRSTLTAQKARKES